MTDVLVARWAAIGVVFVICGLAVSRLSGLPAVALAQAGQTPPPPPPPSPTLILRVEPPPTGIAAAPATPAGPLPVFEVASVKKTLPSASMSMGSRSPGGGRIALTNLPLRQIIMMAWGYRDYQIIGGPGWLTTDRFSITAKAETNAPREELLLMMRSTLVERFKLKYRNEKRELPMYALLRIDPAAPLSPNIRLNECAAATAAAAAARGRGAAPPTSGPPAPTPPALGAAPPTSGPPAPNPAARGAAPPTTGPPGPTPPGSTPPVPCTTTTLTSSANGLLRIPLSLLSSVLGSAVGGTVQDRTGLTGPYEITIEGGLTSILSGGSLQAGAPGSATLSGGGNLPAGVTVLNGTVVSSISGDGRSVFAVIKDLGLKLERRKEPIDVLVIESVEQPDED